MLRFGHPLGGWRCTRSQQQLAEEQAAADRRLADKTTEATKLKEERDRLTVCGTGRDIPCLSPYLIHCFDKNLLLYLGDGYNCFDMVGYAILLWLEWFIFEALRYLMLKGPNFVAISHWNTKQFFPHTIRLNFFLHKTSLISAIKRRKLKSVSHSWSANPMFVFYLTR